MEDLLTVNQIAILLKVHPLTVRRYINEGKLKAVKIAGNVRISREDLQDFSEGYTPQAKTERSTSSIVKKPTSKFQPNDPLFRLRGRGLSMEEFN